MAERKAALLTGTQREFVVEDGGENTAKKRSMRSRIRERVYNGLLDGAMVWAHLGDEERRKIFDAWQDDGDTIEYNDGGVWEDELPDFDRTARNARERFESSLVSLVAFIYLGAKESAYIDAEAIITDGIATAEHSLGNDVEASIELTERFDTEELLTRFEAGDPTLTMVEINHLRREKDVSFEEYREQAFDDVRPPTHGNVDAAEFELEDDRDGSGQ